MGKRRNRQAKALAERESTILPDIVDGDGDTENEEDETINFDWDLNEKSLAIQWNFEVDEPEPPKKKTKTDLTMDPLQNMEADKEKQEFMKFLQKMKKVKKKTLDNNYSKILVYLKELNINEKKMNYNIASRHRRSIDLQNPKDNVKQNKEDLDTVEENILKSKLEEMEEEREVKEIFQRPQPFNPDLKFPDMGLSESTIKALKNMGITNPTDIQIGVIPEASRGRDVVACASTGSGKTLAFLLPIVEKLIRNKNKTQKSRVLIITPSRELGLQIQDVGQSLCEDLGVTFCAAVGGVSVKTQRANLKEKPDIVIATPGRLICHMVATNSFSLEDVEIVVLDEADQMLSEKFTDQLKVVLQRCCKTRQTLLFSATMTDTVKDLSIASLKLPVRIFVNNSREMSCNLHQEIIILKQGNNVDRVPALVHLILKHYKKKVIIFTKMKIQCTYVLILLSLLRIKCAELHSDKSQDERTSALECFKKEEVDVLICTEVAARGIHIEGVNTIINLNLPDTYEQYIHRVGRTARAGVSGVAVSILNEQNKSDKTILQNIRKFAKGPLTRRYLVQGYMADVANIINKLTPMIEEIHSRILEDNQEKETMEALKKPMGEDKPSKLKKSSEWTFGEAMKEPEKKVDKSRTKFDMKMARAAKKQAKH